MSLKIIEIFQLNKTKDYRRNVLRISLLPVFVVLVQMVVATLLNLKLGMLFLKPALICIGFTSFQKYSMSVVV